MLPRCSKALSFKSIPLEPNTKGHNLDKIMGTDEYDPWQLLGMCFESIYSSINVILLK